MRLEATCREFKKKLAAAEACTRCKGGRNERTSTTVVQLPKFDGSMPWIVLHHYLKAMAYHKGWAAHELAMHLLALVSQLKQDVRTSVGC